MNISKFDKAHVLAALYNAAKPLGLGVNHYDPAPMTVAQAREIIDAGNTYFDYVKGRPLKINLAKDDLDLFLYDRDQGGPGAGERAIRAACKEIR